MIAIHHTMREAVQSPVPSHPGVLDIVLWFIQHRVSRTVAGSSDSAHAVDHREEVLAEVPTGGRV
jgi:hypothetical protein